MKNVELLKIYEGALTNTSNSYSKNTIRGYMKDVKEFVEAFDRSVLELDRYDIMEYMDSLNKIGSTYAKVLSGIKNFYSLLMLKRELNIVFNPCEGIKRPKVINKEKVPLTNEQVQAMYNGCKNKRDYAILKLLLSNGLRIHELINLTLRQYQKRDSNNKIILTVTKGGKPRAIYLNDESVRAIDEYLKVRKNSEYDNLFISNGGTPMLDSSLRRTWKSIARNSNEFDDVDVKNMCNHLMRATCATKLNDKGVKISVIQSVLGHSDISTTRRYVKDNEEDIIMAMNL